MLYRQVLAIHPESPEVHYNLGNLLNARGQAAQAVDAFSRAVRSKPDYAEAHNNLGMALAGLGRHEEAIAAYRRALEYRPNQPVIHNNLGIALKERGQFDEAIAVYRRALELKPDYAQACYNLGNALGGSGRCDEAIAAYERALVMKPDLAEAHNNLGNMLDERGRLDEAIAALHRALGCRPDYAEARNNLGNALWHRGQREEAMASYREAIRLKPDYALAWNNLGNAFREQGRLDEAAAIFRRLLEVKPTDADARNNLGNVLVDQGRLDEALASYRGALQIRPAWAQVHSNVVYALHLRLDGDDGALVEEQRRWNRQFSEPLRQSVLPHANDRNPQRRLRIGYVSPDFRSHAVAFFLAPLLEAHDHGAYEIHCYSDVRRSDAVTEWLRRSVDAWHDVRTLPDAALAERVRNDGIDILVDLAMHTAHNRLLTFARQPAPVQVSWLAYPGSTGMESIGYRLTDAHIDPAGQDTGALGGEAIRLPEAWCCYAPVEEFPPVAPLPAEQSGAVTFGSLNQFSKIHEGLMRCWLQLLNAVPGSRLLMICPAGETMERVRGLFTGNGIAPERLELIVPCDWPDYSRLFQRIDVALDSYPCNGMTTTCHSLWMGVPVVTRMGPQAVSRAGSSLLRIVGLLEFVVESEVEYIRVAAEWAGNLPRLAALRQRLRAQMAASPLMDAPRFARNFEAACRTMWRRWCAQRP